MGNTNNDPTVFSEKIFSPIKLSNGTLYYSGIITYVLFYYSLKGINKYKETFLTKTFFRRLVTMMILLGMMPGLWGSLIKTYKSFSNDLNSIYIERKNSSVEFRGTKNNIMVAGNINLINCSNEKREFYVKIKVPANSTVDIKDEYITLKEKVTIHPKNEEFIQVNEEFNFVNERISQYNSRAFEYVIYNEEDEVVFKGDLSDYSLNDHMLKNL